MATVERSTFGHKNTHSSVSCGSTIGTPHPRPGDVSLRQLLTADETLRQSRGRRAVRDRREEGSDVELERGSRAGRRPNEALIDDRGTLVVRMPDFERLRVAVDDPIVRHTI